MLPERVGPFLHARDVVFEDVAVGGKIRAGEVDELVRLVAIGNDLWRDFRAFAFLPRFERKKSPLPE